MSTKTHLTGFELKSRFHRSMTVAPTCRTFRITAASSGSAVVSGVVVDLVVVLGVGLGLISPGAVAG